MSNSILTISKNIDLNECNVILLIDYNETSEEEMLNRFGFLKSSDLLQLEISNQREHHHLKNELLSRIPYCDSGKITQHDFHWE